MDGFSQESLLQPSCSVRGTLDALLDPQKRRRHDALFLDLRKDASDMVVPRSLGGEGEGMVYNPNK